MTGDIPINPLAFPFGEGPSHWIERSKYDALAAELADWKRMRNEAMAVATGNRERINVLEAALDAAKRQPYLGIATNREIEAERACRRAMGHTAPEYRTWEGLRSDIDDTSKLSLRSAPETKDDVT